LSSAHRKPDFALNRAIRREAGWGAAGMERLKTKIADGPLLRLIERCYSRPGD